jgi:hypothetical protein
MKVPILSGVGANAELLPETTCLIGKFSSVMPGSVQISPMSACAKQIHNGITVCFMTRNLYTLRL